MTTFKNKLIITFLFYGFVISFLAVAIIYKFYSSNVKTVNIEKSLYKYEFVSNFFDYNINATNLKLLALKNSNVFHHYLQNNNQLDTVKELFLTSVKSADEIMQLRYIDETGQERIRVQRDRFGTTPFHLTQSHLQNKANRYYFKEISELKHDMLWYSKIDLNKEKGEIEQPIKPVLRVGIPITMNKKRKGILIINIFIQQMIFDMTNDPLFNVYLVDKDGEFLIHPNKYYNWSRYLRKNYTLKDKYPNHYKAILNNDFYQNKNFISKNLFFDNAEEIKVIIEPKLYFVQTQLLTHIQELLLTLFGVVLLSLPLAYIFARKPAKLKEQVDKFNETLEQKIDARTKELHRSNRRLEKLATLDFLTEIPNRRYFFTMGKKLFHSAQRNKILLSMIVLDIDYFKKINDEYGHKIGDQVLISIANTLKKLVRKEDILARVGGEEFAIILDNANLNEAIHIADKIRSNIEESVFAHESLEIHLTTSLGVTQFTKSDEDLMTIYDRADKALYKAKDFGRNCVKYIE
jgi:diguanylate cyclase (GGDEF)-like protein